MRFTFLFIIAVAISLAAIHSASAAGPVSTAAVSTQPVVVVAPEPVLGASPVATGVPARTADVRIGPSSVLYGLKISLENFDESFAPSPLVKIEKQLEHANIRIAEAATELRNNRPDGAETALLQYREKIAVTAAIVPAVPASDPGLLKAQEKAAADELVLGQVLSGQKDHPGLAGARAQNAALEAAFSVKTGFEMQEQVLPDNRIVVQAVKITGPVSVTGQQIPTIIATSTSTPPVPTPVPTKVPVKSLVTPSIQPVVTNVAPSPALTPQPQTTRTTVPVTPQVTPAETPVPTPALTTPVTPVPTTKPVVSVTPQPTPTSGTGTGGNTGNAK
ncbi:MAG: DUF5667 domain-containing protein [Methanoregula sp.]|nr:MAG: DUF5667 domain-containing protein [Methanoregula sp.]